MARSDMSLFARLLTSAAVIEPTELKAVLLSFVYFACLMASYFILRPVRDAMGTVYSVRHLQELFTGTFILSFLVAAVCAGLASRIKLARILPWVYGFIALTLGVFYALFVRGTHDRWGRRQLGALGVAACGGRARSGSPRPTQCCGNGSCRSSATPLVTILRGLPEREVTR